MSNTGSNYRCTSDSDGKLSIKSNMNDWHIISDNVCTKIDVLHDLINIREGNISCDDFTGEEINFHDNPPTLTKYTNSPVPSTTTT